MYLAVAGLGSISWDGEDFEKMKNYVDKKNETIPYNKYCLLDLDNWSWGIYKKNRNLHGCKFVIAYDPCNVANRVIRCMQPDFNFVRNFGGKSRD